MGKKGFKKVQIICKTHLVRLFPEYCAVCSEHVSLIGYKSTADWLHLDIGPSKQVDDWLI